VVTVNISTARTAVSMDMPEDPEPALHTAMSSLLGRTVGG
jgi:hypothetical protein